MVETPKALRFLRIPFLQLLKLLGIQDFSLPDKTNATERKRHVVRGRQGLDYLETFVQLLVHGRVGTVGTNEDVTMIGGVVGALDQDTLVVLRWR